MAIRSVSFVEQTKKLVVNVSGEQPEGKLLNERIPLERIVHVVEAQKGEPWERFNRRYGDWGRALVLYLARKRSGLTLREIGEWDGGTNYKTVSHAVRRLEDRLKEDKVLSRIAEECLSTLAIVET